MNSNRRLRSGVQCAPPLGNSAFGKYFGWIEPSAGPAGNNDYGEVTDQTFPKETFVQPAPDNYEEIF